MGGLRKSSVPRALAENLAPSRARQGIARTLTDDEIATWVAQLAQQYSEERLDRFRDRARDIAADLGLTSHFALLDDSFGAVLGTRPTRRGGLLGARAR